MDYGKLTLFQMMKTKMGYLAEKQDVLSHNVANIDTPGYQAREMRELDFKRLASVYSNKLKMRMTAASHSGGTPRMPDDFREQRDRETFETTPVDNNIVLEEQMAKISETNMDYQKTTNLYRKTNELFKTAIGKN